MTLQSFHQLPSGDTVGIGSENGESGSAHVSDNVGFARLCAEEACDFRKLAAGSAGGELAGGPYTRFLRRYRYAGKCFVLPRCACAQLFGNLLQTERCIETAFGIHEALGLCELEILSRAKKCSEL